MQLDHYRVPKEWTITPLSECCEILDHLRVPVNSGERSFREGTVPYYGVTGQQVWVGLTFQNHLFRLRGKRLDSRFALAWLNSEWVRHYWHGLCGTSSGLNTINSTMLKAMIVPVPSEQKQAQLACALDTHDARIRAEESYLDKLKLIKKGLMEDLLTGRVRVDVLEQVSA